MGLPGPDFVVASWDGTGLPAVVAGAPDGAVSKLAETQPPASPSPEPTPSPPPGDGVYLPLDLSGAQAELVEPGATPGVMIGTVRMGLRIQVSLSRTEVRPKPGLAAGYDEEGQRVRVTVRLSGPAPSGGSQGMRLRLRREGVDGSGGHSREFHRAPRPAGRFGPDGVSFAEFAAQSFTEGYKTLRPGESFQLGYEPSFYGGQERIIVELEEQPRMRGQAVLEVTVPNLVALGPGDGYELVGETQEHPEGTNHFGTAATVGALREIARQHQASNLGSVLLYNDISLQRGARPANGVKWPV